MCVHAECKPCRTGSGEKGSLVAHTQERGLVRGWVEVNSSRCDPPQAFLKSHLLSFSVDEAKDVFEASWDNPSQLMGERV